MKLSVLDQSAALAGRSEAESIRETLALAVHCEALGYHRFWLSEHHNLAAIVGSAPEILMAAIAATTQRIRIGSAGVMLPHYSALKVAEQFRVLEALAPGRIDLGLGRAPGGDMRTAQALNPNAHAAADDFPQQVHDLQAWVNAEGQPHQGIHAHPHGPTSPEMWILGSSDYGAQLAAHFGLPYAFAYFFTDGKGAGALQPPDVVAAQGFQAADQPTLDAMHRRAFVGSAAQVGAQLRALADAMQLDELVVNTWAHDPEVRRHSYALLADEFGLRSPA